MICNHIIGEDHGSLLVVNVCESCDVSLTIINDRKSETIRFCSSGMPHSRRTRLALMNLANAIEEDIAEHPFCAGWLKSELTPGVTND